MTARILAKIILLDMENKKQFSNIVLDAKLESCELSSADKGLVSAIVLGVTEKRITLDYYISLLADRKEIDPEVRCCIRIGLYQLIYLDRIPHHAAINESVALCKSPRHAAFVNAILRTFLRKCEELRLPSAPIRGNRDYKILAVRYLSVKYSVCEPLCAEFLNIFGFERTESLFESFEGAKRTTLRTNTLKISRAALSENIEKSGGTAALTRLSPHGIKVCGAVRDVWGFKDGMFFVQDEASQLCVEFLGAKPGDTLLDVCSAPGSKSFGAAMNMQNKGKIISSDLHKSKISLIENGAKWLGIDIITAAARDAKVYNPELCESADIILCDVPCSGFGVIAKKPELRYKNPAECTALPEIQGQILTTAAKYLKPGGTLIYSTCTIFPKENEDVIHSFLEKNTNFILETIDCEIKQKNPGYITLYPDINNMDGFFAAKLRKTK